MNRKTLKSFTIYIYHHFSIYWTFPNHFILKMGKRGMQKIPRWQSISIAKEGEIKIYNLSQGKLEKKCFKQKFKRDLMMELTNLDIPDNESDFSPWTNFLNGEFPPETNSIDPENLLSMNGFGPSNTDDFDNLLSQMMFDNLF